MKEVEPLLSTLPKGASVAVVRMLGSLCPVTLSHVQCYIEARKILLGEVARPARLEQFDECLGFIALNSDAHVGRKLREKGQKVLDERQRAHLVRLATSEYPWLNHEDCRLVMVELCDQWPHLKFVEFDMNGADDVVKYEKWRFCRQLHGQGDYRMIIMGRPGSTQQVLKGMQDCEIDPEDGKCFLGPELPDISSTAAREAIMKGDEALLCSMLHPAVADWLLRNEGSRSLSDVGHEKVPTEQNHTPTELSIQESGSESGLSKIKAWFGL